jgi:uncharacterized membrane protein YphA (DoxX/SURF4 family)
MDLALWVLQIVVALLFAGAGYSHWLSYERSKVRMKWLASVPRWSATGLGILELAGAVGLVLPAATHVAPWLTPLAASLLAVLMALAVVFHVARREYPNIATNAVLGILAAAVAYGRYVLVPLTG